MGVSNTAAIKARIGSRTGVSELNVTPTPFNAIDTRTSAMQTAVIAAIAAAVRLTRERWKPPSSAIGPSMLRGADVTRPSSLTVGYAPTSC